MPPDAMTPLERLTAYNRGEAIDRLPCVPIVGNTAARVIGANVSEFRGNGSLIAKAQVAAYKRFGYDTIRVFTDLYVLAEAMGAKVHYPVDETAYHEAPAIERSADIEKLQPVDPYRDGNLPQHLEAMKIVLDEVGKEVSVSGAVTCPFTNAAFLIGTEALVRLVGKNPAATHQLCEISLQSALAYTKAMIDIGCTPSLTDPMSSSTIISPRQFREFSYPYLKRLIEYIHARGKSVTLHICGKTSKVLEQMVDAGADCLSLDNAVNLREAKQAVGSRVRLMGNVDPSAVMLQGTPADVRKAVLDCLLQAHDNPKGYIVASGCSLPTETPFHNIDAMIDAVRLAGYPVDLEKLQREAAR